MEGTHCPLCATELEVQQVAPCEQCGAQSVEIEHFQEDFHTFARYKIFGDLQLTLCDFCYVDFGACDMSFYGLPRRIDFSYENLQLVYPIREPVLTHEKCCPICNYSIAFLRFVMQAREQHAG